MAVVFALATTATACAGPYGHSRTYAPTSAESDAAEGSRDYDPVMIEREPQAWTSKSISLFGVVESKVEEGAGTTLATVSLRRLEPRNLCESQASDESCRVTVSDTSFGTARVRLSLRPEEKSGDKSVGPGSLLRVIGKLDVVADESDKVPIVKATYYRHWPHRFYVTRAKADLLRQ